MTAHHIPGILGTRARIAPAVARFAMLALAALPATAAERFDQGLLWRVEGKGAAASHVFGTIHLADPRVTRLPPAVARELDQARSLTLEATFQPGTMLTLAGRMVFTDGRDLQGAAGPELFARTAKLTAALGIPEPMLRSFKPWAVALLLSVPPQDPAEVLDFVLVRVATEQGKPVHDLESMEEQIAIFEDMAGDDQVALLRQAVDDYERMPGLLGRVIEAYIARDLSGIWRVREASRSAGEEARRFHEKFVQRLLYDRNVRMAERAEPRLREGGEFIAVGALHLYGERGLLAQLEKRGWRVTRVY